MFPRKEHNMNLTTIVVSEDEAKAKLAEYEEALKSERNVEDAAIAQAYRAAARGLAVIRLSEAIGAGGYFDSGWPRIAVSRVTEPEVFCRFSAGRFSFANESWARGRGALVGRNEVNVTPTVLPEPLPGWGPKRAPVPLVPPRHRPKRPRLANLHVLWEVETWSPAPSRDPALIKHIRGDLWAVLATWDLTDLELAVLAQRST
jgi:hypothetical protein